MRRKRVIYFNDARHYYLFVYDPPMTFEDAWAPVDEVAGTSVDTFAYGVNRGDGLFYPSKVGERFGYDMPQFEQSAYWRVWHNMQSLIDRGLDPLTLLVDRAHDKGMDFFASLRMGDHAGMDPAHQIKNGGRLMAHPEVREHHLKVLNELVTEYEVEAVEMDLATPGGGLIMPVEGAAEQIPVMTEYVERIAEMARGRGKLLGTRVLPTEEMNLQQGMDVRAWLQQGLIDFAVPIRYAYQLLDADMPIDWLIEAAHMTDKSVYVSLQPYLDHKQVGGSERLWASPEQMAATAAVYWDRGVDGFVSWFLQWPLDSAGRRILTQLGDPELVKRSDKLYVLARSATDDEFHYQTPLPVQIDADDAGTRHAMHFYVADDSGAAADRIRQIVLKIRVMDLVSADRLDFHLNGRSLEDQVCLRSHNRQLDGVVINAYNGQWLEFQLRPDAWPRKGENSLEVTLVARAERLVSPLRVDQVHIFIQYRPYPST